MSIDALKQRFVQNFMMEAKLNQQSITTEQVTSSSEAAHKAAEIKWITKTRQDYSRAYDI